MNLLGRYNSATVLECFNRLPMLHIFPEPVSKAPGYVIDYIIVEDNIILHDQSKTNTIVDFVLTTKGDLRIGMKHLLLAENARCIKGGGSLIIFNGLIRWICNDCGHYKPTDRDVESLIGFFRLLSLMCPTVEYVNYRQLKT